MDDEWQSIYRSICGQFVSAETLKPSSYFTRNGYYVYRLALGRASKVTLSFFCDMGHNLTIIKR